MLGIIEIIIGVIGCVAALAFGVIRVVKNPRGWNFSKAASIRWIIFMALSFMLGVALIAFGCFALLG